jgi:hypothetical protein
MFGEYVAQCLYSKPWQLREAAVSKMTLEVPTLAGKRGRHDVFAACMTIIAGVAKSEKIAAVFTAATTKLLSAVFSACARDVRKAEAQSAVEPLFPLLVEKLGDNVARVRDSAVAAVIEVRTLRVSRSFNDALVIACTRISIFATTAFPCHL